MADTKKPVTLAFTKERETKGTWRYAEAPADGAEPVIGTLYIRKFAAREFVGEKLPDSLRVTIEGT